MVDLTVTAESKLTGDFVAWLTTVRPDGSPVTRPVWFVWRNPELLVYSEPHTNKVHHLKRDARACLNLDSDEEGGSIVVLDVEAVIDHHAAPPSECIGYLAKYSELIARLGVTVDAYDRHFSTLLRLNVRRCVEMRDTLGAE